MSFSERANRFDPDRSFHNDIDNALSKLTEFREKYPFHESVAAINSLTSEDLFNPPHSEENDYFFYWLEYTLKPLGSMIVGSTAVYRNACQNIEVFKDILRNLMDPALTLAEKIDLDQINQIQYLGGEKLVIKKIMSAYDDSIIPIFRTDHLLHFYRLIVGDQMLPRGFDRMSKGEQYQHLTTGLQSVKRRDPITSEWSNPYFMRFLYESYPMSQEPAEQPPISFEKLREYGLYEEPRYEQEVVFLFAKLHVNLGFPTILKIQEDFPDVSAIDTQRSPVRIELEVQASNFVDHGHSPSGCDYVICWENDLRDPWPDHWPSIISIREYLANEDTT